MIFLNFLFPLRVLRVGLLFCVSIAPCVVIGDSHSGNAAKVSSVDQVRHTIDEWLGLAVPPANALFGTNYRYTKWGQLVGETETGRLIQATQPPHEVNDRSISSHRFVWQLRSSLDSVEHCTLEEYVTRRVAELSTESCRHRYRQTMPDLTGLSALAIENSLSALGLTFNVVPGTRAPTALLVSKVQRHNPRAHTPFNTGDVVTVWLFTARNTVAQKEDEL